MQVAKAKASAPAPDKPTLLFIDDEPRVLKSMRAMFRRDFDVFAANSGQEALEIMALQPVKVVISDQRMPHMTGVEVLTEIKERYPGVIRILLTGYADLQAIEDSLNEAEVFRYLMKPCPSDDIRAAIDAGLELADEAPMAEVITLTIPGALGPDAVSKKEDEKKVEPKSPKLVSEGVKRRTRVEQVDSSEAAAGNCFKDVDLAVYGDHELVSVVAKTMERSKVHHVSNLKALAALASKHPLGVVVTDVPIDEVDSIVSFIDAKLPHLVTVVASGRSDANTLIQLINSGPVYRFLLKPVQPGRFALTLNAAIERCTPMSSSAPIHVPEKSRWRRFVSWVSRTQE